MKRTSALAVATSWLLLAACTLPTEQLSLPNAITGSIAKGHEPGGKGVPLSAPASPGADTPRAWAGTGQFTGQPSSGFNAAGVRQGADGVTLNVVEAPIADVARSVLGEILGVTYVVDPRIKGTVTLRTAQPVPKEALLEIFEQVLKSEGALLIVEAGVYRVIPSEAASAAVTGLRSGPRGRRAGYATEVLPLRYVSAVEMERVIRSIAPQATIVRVDEARNLILIAGTSADLASVRETASVFDVDWMRGMSFAMFPIESGDPEAIAQELDVIFANDRDSPTKGIVRFVPNRRLKSVLVITSRPDYLTKAKTWLARVDLVGRASEKQVHVYNVQNRPATELAQLLQRIYASQNRTGSGAAAPLGSTGSGAVSEPPGDSFNSVSGGRRSLDTGQPVLPPPIVPVVPSAPVPAGGGSVVVDPAAGASPTGSTGSVSSQPNDDRGAGIAVVADEANNALVVTATPAEYKRVRQILSQIDIAPAQVLLEATIAEVTLNDRLKFGLRWFFDKGSSEFKLTDAALGTVAPAFPGFSYFLNVPNVQVALNALSAVTDVNVVSSPSLMVLDNKRATLQIGDEVPVATQSAVSVISPGAPIVNSVAFRSTGVILGITPRISENGRVLLEIEQEVSDVVPTTSSSIDSPTIQQRRVKTTVAVGDGQTIVLAGMMQDRTKVVKQQIPLIGNIPLLGNAFKDKDDDIRRTELLIAITPQIVKDPHQIRAIASEFRDRMNFTTRPQRRAPPDRREQIDRVVR